MLIELDSTAPGVDAIRFQNNLLAAGLQSAGLEES